MPQETNCDCSIRQEGRHQPGSPKGTLGRTGKSPQNGRRRPGSPRHAQNPQPGWPQARPKRPPRGTSGHPGDLVGAGSPGTGPGIRLSTGGRGRASGYPKAGEGEQSIRLSTGTCGQLSSYPRADRVPGYPQAEKAGIRLSTGGIPARIPVIQGTPPAEMDSLDKRISKKFSSFKISEKNLLIHLSTYPDPRICAQKGPFSWIACQNSSLSRVSTAGPEKQPKKVCPFIYARAEKYTLTI